MALWELLIACLATRLKFKLSRWKLLHSKTKTQGFLCGSIKPMSMGLSPNANDFDYTSTMITIVLHEKGLLVT